ncbi:signal peptide containing protein [Theileria equi strain WA]|uniref:Signal peptide containing protein n=1 Tax=Theileria equi strain WA TaxID=1537102 RepID=L1L9D4_THEEQ|nr:signal peptide containing protein [Theileria equi strain WA]EKX72106.1 signal peptide containing protein [Theileria equi strain WA]|eukprot:XP_004831558.1 signal peptide containing protein [Theileria equi strain WA]
MVDKYSSIILFSSILLVISPSFDSVNAFPIVHKFLIDFDVSGNVPGRIKVSSSLRYSGGLNYSIKQASRHTHVIGRIVDEDEVLLDGKSTYMSRYVLVVVRDGGAKYVRITTRRREDHKYVTWIREFIKRTGAERYIPVIRTPVAIDLKTQESDEFIKMETVICGNNNDVIKEFTIHRNMQDDFIIGQIQYGEFLIEAVTSEIMERKVALGMVYNIPSITIFTRYADGADVTTKYKFSIDSKTVHLLEETRKLMDLCE